jgi:uncharacterized protein YjgD (DUF1641 family)
MMTDDLALINQKIDYLTAQFEIQTKRQQALEELQNDLIPIVNHIIKLSIDEMAEIGNEFALEDLLFLFKRLLRNTRSILSLLDNVDAVMGLSEEIELLGKQVFSEMVEQMDRMERMGYFNLAREGMKVTEKVVTELNRQGINEFGDGIAELAVNITKPELILTANNAVNALGEQTEENVSLFALMREMFDPKVRKGLARMLNVVKAFSD